MAGFLRLAGALLIVLCYASRTADSLLIDYNANFSALASEVEFELQQKRAFNGALIREFNREMLLEFGTMIPRMREVSRETMEYILNYTDVDEECRDYAIFLLELYRTFQEVDIQYCAYYAFADLEFDALNRFLPYEQSYSRENYRSISQTVITLGRNNVQDQDAVAVELADEWVYFTNLRETYNQILEEELAKHGDDAYVTINQFERCRDEAYYWQDSDMEYIRSYLVDNCYL